MKKHTIIMGVFNTYPIRHRIIKMFDDDYSELGERTSEYYFEFKELEMAIAFYRLCLLITDDTMTLQSSLPPISRKHEN